MKILNQITLLLLVFIATTFSSIAQNNPKTNLWKIEGDSIKTSYLFGTIHIIPKDDFKITEKVQNAFDVTEHVILEVDMADPNFTNDMMKFSMLKENEELKSYMSDDEYLILNNHLKEKSGISVDNFNKFKPFMLMSMIQSSGLINGSMESYEMTLIKMATEANKEIDGLETFADQLKAIDGDSYEKQIDDLVYMVDNIEESEEMYSKLLALYLDEDVDGMFDFMDEYMRNDTEAIKRFLDDRNEKWIPKFAEYSKEQSVFYAVGGAHLGGEQGVINLLKNAGYKVTPVTD